MDNKTTLRRPNGKRIEGKGLAIKMARDIKGMSLAQAYVVLKSLGISIRVLTLDNERISGFGSEETSTSRVDVDVCNGVVKHAWVK